jgi:membrane protease YdiL (CAAX protease family)
VPGGRAWRPCTRLFIVGLVHGTDNSVAVSRLAMAPVRRGPRSLLGRLALFLVLAYGLSWWPWPLGDLAARPDTALMVPIGPSIAAVVMVFWLHGRAAGRALLRALVHVRVGRWWLVLLIPVGVAVAAACLALLAGAPAPSAADVLAAAAGAVITAPLVAVVAGPLGEELGWRGYVLPTLLSRYRPIAATLLLMPMWIMFHLPWIINKPAQYGPAWAVALVGMALTMTWMYVGSGGSLALAVAFHTVVNTATPAALQLFAAQERPLAWGFAAALWLAAGAIAAYLLRDRVSDVQAPEPGPGPR